jgi:tetratricopeptide (TPR) repeat protein
MFRLILGTILILLACPAAGRGDPASDVAEGLSWLHSFEYERALAAFERAEKADRGSVMACWGQAMCYQQLLWGNENVEEARAILGRLRRSGAVARATAQEREWIATLDVLFGAGDRSTRLGAFAAAMASLAANYPADPDVAAFHGLALMATRARGLAGAHHAGERETPQLAGSREQEQAAQIFMTILREHPKHPGALHYLIHAWDDPQNAQKAVEEARLYATLVPESSHARHMPAHVFMQLGLWTEAIASDAAAAAAAEARVATDRLPVTAADFHPLSWLVYEYAQAGRFADAHAALSRLQTPAEATRDPRLLSLLATLRSRLAIEEQNWTAVRGPGFINYDELFAVGFSAAQRGDAGLAERARIRLGELSQQPRYADRRRLLEIMAMQVGAVIRSSSNDHQGALALLAEATAAERALPASIGPPALIKPAQEQYAELLLQRGRAPEAAAQFEGALERAKNRRLSAQGLERARALTSQNGAGTSRRGAVAGGGGVLLLLILLIAARRRHARAA